MKLSDPCGHDALGIACQFLGAERNPGMIKARARAVKAGLQHDSVLGTI